MEIGALQSSLNIQASVGQLVTETLDQATAIIQQQQALQVAQQNIEATSKALESGLGELLDVIA